MHCHVVDHGDDGGRGGGDVHGDDGGEGSQAALPQVEMVDAGQNMDHWRKLRTPAYVGYKPEGCLIPRAGPTLGYDCVSIPK